MKNADTPAMPTALTEYTPDGKEYTQEYEGLTKREMFAMHAMQGLLSDSDYADSYETAKEWRKNVSEAAVEFADALLKELEK